MDRFERQYVLPGFGVASQQKLQEAKVLLIGSGGLGCPALLYLAAAGVGTIGILDGDVVALSNLNRQVLFSEQDVGKSKAEVAGSLLRQKYSDIKILVIPEFITVENALEIIFDYDLVVDGSDNFPTRYLVNDACVLLGKPLVLGAIYQHEGQVAVLNATKDNPTNYRDVYPQPPGAHEVPNCNETGVLGVLPGIVGTMLATETIKYLTGFSRALVNRMLFYNILSHQTYEIEITPNPRAMDSAPKSGEAFKKMDYNVVCGLVKIIPWDRAMSILAEITNSVLVDVREDIEQPKIQNVTHVQVPVSVLDFRGDIFQQANTILVFCQSGVRSQKVASLLTGEWPDKNIYSIEGGVNSPDSPVKQTTHGN